MTQDKTIQNTTIQNTNDLLGFLVQQAEDRKEWFGYDILDFLVHQSEDNKNWFGFTQQRMTAVSLAHEIAKRHADKMTPNQIVEYAIDLNNVIFNRIIKAKL
jgi:hypothetical protein